MTEDQIKRMMFDCERKPKTRVTRNTCIARQKLIHKPPKGTFKRQYNDAMELCYGCEKGIELYKKNKKKGKKKMTQTVDNTITKNENVETLTSSQDTATNNGTYNSVLFIDLREEPALMKKIQEWANMERRTPENQILYHLENTVLGEI